MKIARLKPYSSLIAGYCELRNNLRDKLHSDYVTELNTQEWLKGEVVVLVATENVEMCGAVVLDKLSGEITVFHNGSHKGLGSELLKAVENYADMIGLRKIWAWTDEDNDKSIKLFNRSGFNKGIHFIKKL